MLCYSKQSCPLVKTNTKGWQPPIYIKTNKQNSCHNKIWSVRGSVTAERERKSRTACSLQNCENIFKIGGFLLVSCCLSHKRNHSMITIGRNDLGLRSYLLRKKIDPLYTVSDWRGITSPDRGSNQFISSSQTLCAPASMCPCVHQGFCRHIGTDLKHHSVCFSLS